MISSDDLLAFSIVARNLNVSKAAKEMGRSQSAVSRQIIKLESLIGERLFTRTKRDLILTEIGRKLLVEAREVLTPLERINARFFQEEMHGRRTLSVGMTPSLGMDFVALFTGAIEKLYPDLELKIHLDFSEPLLNDLTHNRIELAFTVIPENIPKFLSTIFSYQERFYVVGKEIPEDMRDARWVLIQRGTHSRYLIDQYLRREIGRYRLHFEINGFHNIIPYLKNSDDLSVLPSSMMWQAEGLNSVPLPLYRNCGLLVGSESLAGWMSEVVREFQQEFVGRYNLRQPDDIIPGEAF